MLLTIGMLATKTFIHFSDFKSLNKRNPVAKNSGKFNKAKIFKDKTKYSRKDQKPQ